jgi:hypothetical protein
MSEQDKRVVYMGNFERFKKETQVKHEDMLVQMVALSKLSKYHIIMSGLALGIAIVALAI